jgi:TRAP-type uncharacterized transport system fused permease subunit
MHTLHLFVLIFALLALFNPILGTAAAAAAMVKGNHF